MDFTEARSQQLAQNFKDKVEKGLGPDLIYTESVNNLSLLQTEILHPLDQYSIDLLKFRPQSLVQVLSQGKLYGLPFSLHTQVLCYNKNKVQEIPRTLSELIIQARKGYSVGMVSSFYETIWGLGIFGGKLLDGQGNLVINQNSGWVDWMKWLKNARNEPNFILNDDLFVLQDAFINGKLAYNVCWSNQIPFFRESLGADNLGVALLPSGNNNEKPSPLLISSNFLFSSASSRNQTQIALNFVQFLINAQQQTEIAVKYRSIISANKQVDIDPRLFPIQGILEEQSQTGLSYGLDQVQQISFITKYGDDFYIRIIAGEISPEQAADQLVQIVNQEFEPPPKK